MFVAADNFHRSKLFNILMSGQVDIEYVTLIIIQSKLSLRCSAVRNSLTSNGDYILHRLVLECLLLFSKVLDFGSDLKYSLYIQICFDSRLQME